MPKMVSEISQGMNFDFTMEQGAASVQSSRAFRILKNSPDEGISLNTACEVNIGDEHPRIPGIYCYHFTGAYEGDSRMVILATFDYRATPSSQGGGSDPQGQPPDLRPVQWQTSSSLIEMPAYTWDRSLFGAEIFEAQEGLEVINPVGDLYEGVTKMVPVVTITADQFEPNDPTKHNEHAGKTNDRQEKIGSLDIPRRCLMFRGVTSKPATESWGGVFYSGWMCTYEFLFRRNRARFSDADGILPDWQDVGWDVLQPVSGFNCKAFVPPGNAQQDPYGQPLKWNSDGEIVLNAGVPSLPDGVAAGDKVRAHVKVGVRGGKQGQRPSAMPIALNDDGTPRKETAVPKVLVRRYKVTDEIELLKTLELRLN